MAVVLQSEAEFRIGMIIYVEPGTSLQEQNQIVGFGPIMVKKPLQHDHAAGGVLVGIGCAQEAPEQASSNLGLIIVLLVLGLLVVVLVIIGCWLKSCLCTRPSSRTPGNAV